MYGIEFMLAKREELEFERELVGVWWIGRPATNHESVAI